MKEGKEESELKYRVMRKSALYCVPGPAVLLLGLSHRACGFAMLYGLRRHCADSDGTLRGLIGVGGPQAWSLYPLSSTLKHS